MPLVDSEQREKALSLQSSFVIRAPAGSGKTELLIQRLLNALAHIESPHHCLVLTFTQKAVRELQERLVKIFRLPNSELLPKTAVLREQVIKHAQDSSWSMTTFWHQVKIKTLDAFFMELVEKYQDTLKAEANNRTISPEIQSELIVSEFFQEYLIKNPDPDFVSLCASYENAFTQIHSLLEKLYLTRETWMIPILSDQEESPCAESLLKEQLGRYINLILEHREFIEKLFLWTSSYESSQSIDFEDHSWAHSLSFWKRYAHMMVTDSGSWRKKLTKHQGFVADKDLHPWHEKKEKKSLVEEFFQVQACHADDPHFLKFLTLLALWPESFVQTDYQQSWLKLLKKLLAFSMVYKEKKGYVDYSDITLNLWTLFHSTEIWPVISAEIEKNVSHLFLDECQDLSLIQFSLIKKILSLGAYHADKTFFVVGDPQQAIYHFRGSQVGVFQAFEQLDLQGVQFETLYLKTNFRSQHHLVSFYNTWSAQVFSSFSSPFLGVDKSLAASPLQENQGGRIEGLSYCDQRTEARSIALRVKKFFQQGSKNRVAILARDRQSLKPLMKQFLLLDIPFKTTGIYHLLDLEKYFDTFVLIRLLMDPSCQSFWIPAMRSFYLGASAQDLVFFCQEKRETFFQEALDERYSESFRYFYQLLKKHFEQFSPYLGRLRLDKWLRNFFVSYGIREYFSRSQYTLWLEMCSLFSPYHFESIPWPIIEKQLRAIPVGSSGECAVEMMTIHQSKGLEFDHVYLPNLAAALPHSKSQLLYSIQTEHHHLWTVLPPPARECDTVNFCQFLTKMHREHEFVRLLYVALTRAKEVLHLSYNEEKNFGKNFKTLLEPFVAFERQKVSFENRVEYADREISLVLPRSHRVKALDWSPVSYNSDPLTLIKPQRSQERTRILGLVWHKILQYNNTWPLNEALLSKSALESLLGSFGATEQDLPYLLSEFSKTYQSLKSSENARLFYGQPYIQDLREFVFTYQREGKLMKKVVDRVIEESNGDLHVIEIKTSSLELISPDLLETYIRQILFYQKSLASLYKKTCKGTLWFLKDDKVYQT